LSPKVAHGFENHKELQTYPQEVKNQNFSLKAKKIHFERTEELIVFFCFKTGSQEP